MQSSDLMPYYRLVHLVAATFWVGANFFMACFLYPAAKAAGERGSGFLGIIARINGLPFWMNVSAVLTVLSGVGLLSVLSSGFEGRFFAAPYGASLLVATALTLVAYFHGFLVLRPCGMKMGALGGQLAAGAGDAAEGLRKQMRETLDRMSSASRQEAFILLIVLILMVMAKFL